MRLYNIKDHNEQVSFIQATKKGLGSKQGLFFPVELPKLDINTINSILKTDFLSRSYKILSTYIGNEITPNNLFMCIENAFSFPISIRSISSNISCLELFHGPTLAFKDFGGRFLSQILSCISDNQHTTILTATSGDTGAAISHAFYGMENIRVVILYPQHKISPLQEKLFCTIGGNIETIALEGDFDTCQSLVKMAFNDKYLSKSLNLNSANSINICRLLAQICYYFEAVAHFSEEIRNQLVISVPSGNFGNLTAGLLARSLGLPVKRFIAATNVNDTVPRFLNNGIWNPKKTIQTISNAMDVSNPNNWPRIQELFQRKSWELTSLSYGVVSDKVTRSSINELDKIGYLVDPHSAISWHVLKNSIKDDEHGLFIGTAHFAKFQDIVQDILGREIVLPNILTKHNKLPLLSYKMKPNFSILRDFLLK
ncbi:threonine synthase [Candidatus Pantoea edessiphila]|uniref:Threonine synthase n=1 Tax=Candidatus Pantoea edessiphila TaxID=2044610 RepID=A0A2P5SY63_9GAMM|nr:threonine synthase [Candidatus Pantoea edessiphila]MBK4775618.1 threonine synthase [Pantoea sp. Edef]PPI87265.1 threonine synthase [Candidatus Pantoea edessiphila]